MLVNNNESKRKPSVEKNFDASHLDAKMASLTPPEKTKLTLRSTISITLVISSMFFNGTIYGYMSPALLSMQQQSTASRYSMTVQQAGIRNEMSNNIVLSDSEASWVSSLSSIGFIFGGLISGLAMRLLGRKYSSIFGLGLSYFVGYALIAFAPIKPYIFAGRFFGGICQGFCNCVTTLYVLELCNTHRQKAICGILLSVFGNFGTLITYLLGVFLDWRKLALTLMVLSGPYILGMMALVPETIPRQRLSCSRSCFGEDSSKYTVDDDDDGLNHQKKVIDDNSTTTSNISDSKESTSSSTESLVKKIQSSFQTYQSFLNGVFLIFFVQFGGYNIVSLFAATIIQMDMKANSSEPYMMNYTEDVFNEEECSTMARLDRTALWAAVGVALAGLVGVLAGVALVHRGCNRKKMLISSALGIFIAFAGLGTFLIITNDGEATGEVITRWVITVALVLHLLVFNIGFGCLGFPVAAEIMPGNYRSKGMALITASAGIFGFLNSKSYHDLKFYTGSGGTFVIYGSINLFAAIFIQFRIPDL